MDDTLFFNPDDHTYWLKGDELPSVTTALKVLSRPWPETAHSIAARELGSAVHLTCHYDDLGVLAEETLDDALHPYLTAYREFKKDHRHSWRHVEQPMYHPQLFYAGTPDRSGELDGNEVVLDLKTGEDYATYPLQLAAYAHLLPEKPGTRVGLFLKPDGTYKLKYFPENEIAGDFGVFCAALNVYNWKRRKNIG